MWTTRRLIHSLAHRIPCYSARNMSTTTTESSRAAVKLAVVQLNSKEDKEENFFIAKNLIETASKQGARMAFLPECFDMICPTKQSTLENGESIDGPTITAYRRLASENSIWLSLGGLHEKDVTSNDERLFNAHVIIDATGEIVSIYRKVHLFNLDIPGTRLMESEFAQPGGAVIKPVATPVGNVGQAICYDLRFAELAISLAKGGADIITYPSSFTVPTGKAHWETLLKARAIETQCYVVAAGQSGAHNAKRSSYGHSMVVDPWGVILAQLDTDGPGVALAEVNFDHLADVRRRLPVWTDRRPELYGYITPAAAPSLAPTQKFGVFRFGHKALVEAYQVFAQTQYSLAFVNHRPVLPGHVLISPRRSSAKRLADLTQPELIDLFGLVQRVQRAVESIYATCSSTVAIQDGVDAGQSVEHLHVHLLPRKADDFGGNVDEIYVRLQQHDKSGAKFGVRIRTVEEMTIEAERLRQFFP